MFLQILNLECADRCGRPVENVIQTFVRTASLCVIPVIVNSVMTYFMVSHTTPTKIIHKHTVYVRARAAALHVCVIPVAKDLVHA